VGIAQKFITRGGGRATAARSRTARAPSLRDHWLEHWEREAILKVHDQNPLEANGKIERWHRSLKEAAIRPSQPSSPDEAQMTSRPSFRSARDVTGKTLLR
jgi:hypothetical protein